MAWVKADSPPVFNHTRLLNDWPVPPPEGGRAESGVAAAAQARDCRAYLGRVSVARRCSGSRNVGRSANTEPADRPVYAAGRTGAVPVYRGHPDSRHELPVERRSMRVGVQHPSLRVCARRAAELPDRAAIAGAGGDDAHRADFTGSSCPPWSANLIILGADLRRSRPLSPPAARLAPLPASWPRGTSCSSRCGRRRKSAPLRPPRDFSLLPRRGARPIP